MGQVNNILHAVGEGERAAASLLSLADRAAGILGRGGARWHRWRSLQLRLRAARVAEQRPAKATELRLRAGLHLYRALMLEHAGADDSAAMVALLRGCEPLAEQS